MENQNTESGSLETLGTFDRSDQPDLPIEVPAEKEAPQDDGDKSETEAQAQNQHSETPPNILRAIKGLFFEAIELDPCGSPKTPTGALTEFHLPEKDGLKERWQFSTIYCCPPYAPDQKRKTKINDWLRKCAEANKKFGAEVVALVPVATNTQAWKDSVWPFASAINFLFIPRVPFELNGKILGRGAPMACALVYYGRNIARFKIYTGELGRIVVL